MEQKYVAPLGAVGLQGWALELSSGSCGCHSLNELASVPALEDAAATLSKDALESDRVIELLASAAFLAGWGPTEPWPDRLEGGGHGGC